MYLEAFYRQGAIQRYQGGIAASVGNIHLQVYVSLESLLPCMKLSSRIHLVPGLFVCESEVGDDASGVGVGGRDEPLISVVVVLLEEKWRILEKTCLAGALYSRATGCRKLYLATQELWIRGHAAQTPATTAGKK